MLSAFTVAQSFVVAEAICAAEDGRRIGGFRLPAKPRSGTIAPLFGMEIDLQLSLIEQRITVDHFANKRPCQRVKR